jgi:hypothetical protein
MAYYAPPEHPHRSQLPPWNRPGECGSAPDHYRAKNRSTAPNPLQYELVDSDYYLGSARGAQADWFRNLQADPCVQVQTRQQRFTAQAEAVTNPALIADFLAVRMRRHPIFVGLLLRLEGLPLRFSRADLERIAAGKALAILHPDQNPNLTE